MRTQRQPRSVSDFPYRPLIAAVAMALTPQSASAINYPVTTSNDGFAPTPPGSLRAAIEAANTTCGVDGPDAIVFDFSNGPFAISTATELPVITCSGLAINGSGRVSISPSSDAFTQSWGLFSVSGTPIGVQGMEVSGYTYGTGLWGNIVASGNNVHHNSTGIETVTGSVVNNNQVWANDTGIYVSYGGATVQNNHIHSNTWSGIDVAAATGVQITGNRIGPLDSPDPNITGNSNGINLWSSRATIDGNVILGNSDYGIYMSSDQGSTITRNKIGTNSTGNAAVPNFIGVYLGSSSSGVSITDNVISGNGHVGVDLGWSDGAIVNNNRIGTDASGMNAVPNFKGVYAYCSSSVMVSNNVISANSSSGIEFRGIQGGGSVDISGNRIGVAGDGVTALGNNSYGVLLAGDNCTGIDPLKKAIRPRSATLDTTNNVAIVENTIRYNGWDGVNIQSGYNNKITSNAISSNAINGVIVQQGTGNVIAENNIYANANKNINLLTVGGNDPGDTDGDIPPDTTERPNAWQNYPVIDSAIRDTANGWTVVSFTLDSKPGTYRVEIFGNDSATPGGQRLVGGTFVTVTSGPASGSYAVSGLTEDNFSLTATSLASEDTSEFSPVATVVKTPMVNISPPGLNFGNVPVGTTSSPQTVTIASTGSADYSMGSFGANSCYGGPICYGGPFICSTNCRTIPMAPGNSCSITATFAPTVTGSYSTTIRICDNVAPFTRSIVLTGSALVPPPVTVTPPVWDYGDVLVGTKSPPQTFTVRNPGASPVPLGPVSTSGDFVLESTDCGSSLAAGNTCNADVTFAPSQPGAASGSVYVNAFDTPAAAARKLRGKAASAASAQLFGNGVVQAGLALPESIDFGAYTLGTAPLRQTVTIRNNGNAVLTFSNVSVDGPFVLGNGCPTNVPPGGTCTITLDFSSATLGSFTGALNIVSNVSGGTRSIPITARAVATASPIIRVNPTAIGFGDRLFGTTSPTQRVTVTNEGNAPATLGTLSTTTHFTITTTTCGLTLAPQATCFADVAFKPAGFRLLEGQLTVPSNSVGSPHVVSLSGSGCSPFNANAAARRGKPFDCNP